MGIKFDISTCKHINDELHVCEVCRNAIAKINREQRGLTDCESLLLGILVGLVDELRNFRQLIMPTVQPDGIRTIVDVDQKLTTHYVHPYSHVVDVFRSVMCNDNNDTSSIEKLQQFDRHAALQAEIQKKQQLQHQIEQLQKQLAEQQSKLDDMTS